MTLQAVPASSEPQAVALTREQLFAMVWSSPLKGLADQFGISGNGLAKICERMLIPHPPRGYWGRSPDRRPPPPALPPAPLLMRDDPIVISARARAGSRRKQTRKPLGERREQLLAIAGAIITAEGLSAVSLKRIAREAGVSEALIRTYFSTLGALLTALARRENEDMNASMNAAMAPFQNYIDRAHASSIGYLEYVARRGGLLQNLLGSPEVRRSLRSEYQARRSWSAQQMAGRLTQEFKIDSETAAVGAQILRAVTVRSGKLIATGKLDLGTAKRLTQAITRGGRRRLLERAAS